MDKTRQKQQEDYRQKNKTGDRKGESNNYPARFQTGREHQTSPTSYWGQNHRHAHQIAMKTKGNTISYTVNTVYFRNCNGNFALVILKL